MRVLVIGASGFTGQRVLAACPAGWSMVGMIRSDASRRLVEQSGHGVIVGDLDEPQSVVAAIRGSEADAVITLASLGFGHADDLVESLLAAGTQRAVFTSTTGIFTKLQPSSKQLRVAAEEAIQQSALDATIIRPTMIYGRPGDRNMERLLGWLKRAPVVVAPNGGQASQQPVHVDDLASALIAAVASSEAIGQSINVPGPEPLSFAEIVSEGGRALDRRARVVNVPVRLLRGVVSLQERLPTHRLKAEQIDRLVEDKIFDGSEAARLLGHAPRSFAEGIAAEARLLGLAP